jgi:glycosyltransferase involved in cell wall biosynthesis
VVKPLLSICIPTYNRSEYLDKSIAALVSQVEFKTDNVELIISDNASDDNTESVVKKYQEQYKNIYYNRNDTNLKWKNFPIVIEKAHGLFRKLLNDTIILRDGTVREILELIKMNIEDKPVLFFLNGCFKYRKQKKYYVNNLDSFANIASFQVTWSTGFGIWEEDFAVINKGIIRPFWHTKILLAMINEKKKVIINNEKLFVVQDVNRKDVSYNIYDMFYTNYLNIYRDYLERSLIAQETFNYLRKHILLYYFAPLMAMMYFNRNNYVLSPDDNYSTLIFSSYKKERYYLFFRLKLFYHFIRQFVKHKIFVIVH